MKSLFSFYSPEFPRATGKSRSGLIFGFLVFAFSYSASAQLTKAEMKVYKKCEKLYEKKKYSDAVEKFDPVLVNHPDDCRVLDVAIKYQQADYFTTASQNSNVIVVGAKTNTKKLANQLTSNMLGILLKYSKKNKLISTLKTCALKCENNESAQMVLRLLTIEEKLNPDTAISSDAQRHCGNAEQYFMEGDYDQAIRYFKKALAEEPDYKMALVHLGDCYYMKKDYEKSVEYFTQAAQKWPKLLEPQKYLTDALIQLGDNAAARKAALNGILRYPDAHMFATYAQASNEGKQSLDRQWIARNAPIASYMNNPLELTPVPSSGSWEVYSNAKNGIKQFCDTSTGIIVTPNSLTNAKYLEVYAWEKMLESTSEEDFEFAKKMQKEGYLDCYVFISLFHVDLYDQHQDFVANNAEKVAAYLDLLIKEMN